MDQESESNDETNVREWLINFSKGAKKQIVLSLLIDYRKKKGKEIEFISCLDSKKFLETFADDEDENFHDNRRSMNRKDLISLKAKRVNYIG